MINLFLIFLISITMSSAFSKCGNNANNFCNIKLVEVYDGDTFFVNIQRLHPLIGKRLGVRVWGVDTPEIRTKDLEEKVGGLAAREFTKMSLKEAKKINLIDCKRGKYSRIVCKVEYDGKDLTTELIKNGYGKPYMQ